jgi:hypothetical protein
MTIQKMVCFLKCVDNSSTDPHIRLSFKSGQKAENLKSEGKVLIRFHNIWPYVRPATLLFTNLSQYMDPNDRPLPPQDSSDSECTTWQTESLEGDDDVKPDLMHPSKKEVYINGVTSPLPGPHPQRDYLLMYTVRKGVNWVLVQGFLPYCQSEHGNFLVHAKEWDRCCGGPFGLPMQSKDVLFRHQRIANTWPLATCGVQSITKK